MLCNPTPLIRWRQMEPPKYKKDWPGCYVRVTTGHTRHYYDGEVASVPGPGAVYTLRNRYKACSGPEWTLTLDYHCPACGARHERTLAEAALASGEASFVEPDGLYDHSLNPETRGQLVLYLAAPYTGSLEEQISREAAITDCAAWLMDKGYGVMSPVTMGHEIGQQRESADGSFAAWREVCLRMLEACDAMVLLTLPGWRESVGVAAEAAHAAALGIPINLLERHDGATWLMTPGIIWSEYAKH